MEARASLNDILNTAFERHIRRSLRSEELEGYEQYFIDPLGSEVLLEAGAQILYGRGGTGKTLVSSALTQRAAAVAKDSRVGAVHFTATDFQYVPDYDNETSIHEKTHVYFHLFIQQLCDKLVLLTDSLLEQPGWWQTLTVDGGEALRRRELVQKLLNDLTDAARYGVLISEPGKKEASYESAERGASKYSLGGTAGMGASPSGAKLRAGLHAQAARGFESESSTHTSFISNWRFSPLAVKDILIRVIDALELSHLVVFIDEWMTLDECQVDFADRLRKTFMHESRIAVKIATDRFQTKFNNSAEGSAFRGIDVGRDASIALDLDTTFTDIEAMKDFFATALYVRMKVFDERMRVHFGDPPEWNRQRFIGSVFASPHAFTEACAASHGICRDFYEVMRLAYKQAGPINRQNRITVDHVRSSVIAMSTPLYTRAAESPIANSMLFELLAPHIRKTRSRYFAVQSSDRHTHALAGLNSKRIVHPISSQRLHPTLRGRFEVFEISACVYLDLMRAVEWSTGEEVDDRYSDDEVLTITENTVNNYLLSPADVRAAADGVQRLCPYCLTEFSEKERAFAARRICPSCFKDQEVTSDG
ncbi:MAG: hypothetical protein WBH03_12190 [Cyclobacteriaceae bacterium]